MTAQLGFEVGEEIRRLDLHARFGGQRQGGISTPAKHPLILIFTGSAGSQHGYEDGWQDGVFCYFGEGQTGDMEFERGNRAIRGHIADGKDLLLFQMVRTAFVRFVGSFIAGSWEYRRQPDTAKTMRQAIVFHLSPVDFPIDAVLPLPASSNLPLAALRLLAWKSGAAKPSQTVTQAAKSIIARSSDVRRYALARASGICEHCAKAAPFISSDGSPYLEVHHLKRLTDGGPDLPNAVAAICPNCHRRFHNGVDGATENAKLIKAIQMKEPTP